MRSIQIKLSQKQLKTLEYLSEDNKEVTEVFYGGAAGGGKSFIGCVWLLYRALNYPGTRGLLGRSKYKALKVTTLKTLIEVWNSYFQYNSAGITIKINYQDGVIYFSNGSEIHMRDLFFYPSDPDFHSLGSLEVTHVFIDEAVEITQKAFNILSSRIRYKLPGGVPKILLSSNPAHNWVKFRYKYDSEGKPVRLKPYMRVIQAKVDDNPNKEFARIYKSNLEKLPSNDRRRLLDGDWTYIPSLSPFFYEFDEVENLSSTMEIMDGELILFSFDFNHNPCTCVVSQLLKWPSDIGGGLYFLDEFAVKGGTSKLCDEIIRRYDIEDMRHLIRVTGDNSGVKKSSSAGNTTDYKIIMDKLKLSPNQLIDVSTANLRHTDSQRLCNYAIVHVPTYFDVLYCKKTIQDVRYAQFEDGNIIKDDAKGIGMHLLDCVRYSFNAWYLNKAKSVRKVAQVIDPDYWRRKLDE